MGELLAILWPSYRKQLSEGICRLFNSKVGCDFEINLNDDSRSIQIHSFLFQIFCRNRDSSIEYFRFEDEEMCADDVRCLLEFLYSGKTYVQANRLEVVKRAAEKMGLDVFVDIIQEIMKKRGPTSDEDDAAGDSNAVTLHFGAVASILDESEYVGVLKTQKLKEESRTIVRKLKYSSSRNEVSEIEERNQVALDFGLAIEVPEASESVADSNKPKLDENSGKSLAKIVTKKPKVSKAPEEDLVCSVCDRAFKQKKHFLLHVEGHYKSDRAGADLQRCSYCSFKVSDLEKHLLKRHCRDIDGNLLEKSLKCDQCDFACAVQRQLDKHKASKHAEPALKCDHCPRVFRLKGELRRHTSYVHPEGGERSFMCDICGACFKNGPHLKFHRKHHSSVKVTCDVCGTRVADYGLKKHQRIMHAYADKRFKCVLCASFFKQRENLKLHIKSVHKVCEEEAREMMRKKSIEVTVDEADEAGKDRRKLKESVANECAVCDKTFKTKSILKRHMKKHGVNRTEYKCPLCEYSAQERYQLKAHYGRKHEMEEVGAVESDSKLKNVITEEVLSIEMIDQYFDSTSS